MELMTTRLQFGVLNGYGSGEEMEERYGGAREEGAQVVRHCAFGVPSELSPVRRGDLYAGLRRRTVVVGKEKVG
jgi:hypothetical protein